MKLFISGIKSISNATGLGGISLSFDDNLRVPSWLAYHENYGISRNWRASFGVNKQINITPQGEQDVINILQAYGHEIWNHTTNHPCDVDTYMLTHTAEDYYNTYVLPNDVYWQSLGLNPMTSFGYPCGNQNTDVTNYLLSSSTPITFVRGYQTTSPNPPLTTTMTGIYNGTNNDIGLGFDPYHLTDYDPQKYMDLLKFCRDNNKIAMLVGHWIGAEYGGAYVETQLLNDMIDYCNANGMTQYLLSELINI